MAKSKKSSKKAVKKKAAKRKAVKKKTAKKTSSKKKETKKKAVKKKVAKRATKKKVAKKATKKKVAKKTAYKKSAAKISVRSIFRTEKKVKRKTESTSLTELQELQELQEFFTRYSGSITLFLGLILTEKLSLSNLENCYSEDIFQTFKKQSDSMTMEEKLEARAAADKFIDANMSPDSGLCDKLKICEFLDTTGQLKLIDGKNLEMLKKLAGQYDGFIEKLAENGLRDHIASYLTIDSVLNLMKGNPYWFATIVLYLLTTRGLWMICDCEKKMR